MGKVAVVGSANVDLVFYVDRLPLPGETRYGQAAIQCVGGKGANQAVAAARFGVPVDFFGKVGSDQYGDFILQNLQENRVNINTVFKVKECPSGMASVWVDQNGNNCIIYIPGANKYVDTDYAKQIMPFLTKADILLLQLEIPKETIEYILDNLPKHSPLVILDPAPVQDLVSLPVERIDILTPNLIEMQLLTGEKAIEKMGKELLNLGIKTIICKAGENGAFLISKQVFRHFPAFPVTPIDTTGAGDAFNGVLAGALAEGRSLEEALYWANAAGALSCTRRGAQPSFPMREELEFFLKKYPCNA
jgi:ribokinase